MPRTKTADRRQQLRDALIEAADRALAGGGLEAIRARDLAEQVGCALGTIYNVFPDLDTLILEANSLTLAAIGDSVRRAYRRSSGAGPEARLETLALTYLAYAASHTSRWRALFEHRMAGGRPVPDWYLVRQQDLFALIEGPAAELAPGLDGAALSALARTLFSAVHGVVSLGLDEKLMPTPRRQLERQTRFLVETLTKGLALTNGVANGAQSASRRRQT